MLQTVVGIKKLLKSPFHKEVFVSKNEPKNINGSLENESLNLRKSKQETFRKVTLHQVRIVTFVNEKNKLFS